MKPLPPETVERMRRLAQVHSLRTVAELVGCTRECVSKVKARGWRPGSTSRHPERPADFAIQAEHLAERKLAEHYRCSRQTVRRWLEGIDRTPAWRTTYRYEMPTALDLASALIMVGLKGACARYGVCETTMKKWRKHYGMPVSRARRAGRRIV